MTLTSYTIGIVTATVDDGSAPGDGPLIDRIVEMIRQAQCSNELVDVQALETKDLGTVSVDKDGGRLHVDVLPVMDLLPVRCSVEDATGCSDPDPGDVCDAPMFGYVQPHLSEYNANRDEIIF